MSLILFDISRALLEPDAGSPFRKGATAPRAWNSGIKISGESFRLSIPTPKLLQSVPVALLLDPLEEGSFSPSRIAPEKPDTGAVTGDTNKHRSDRAENRLHSGMEYLHENSRCKKWGFMKPGWRGAESQAPEAAPIPKTIETILERYGWMHSAIATLIQDAASPNERHFSENLAENRSKLERIISLSEVSADGSHDFIRRLSESSTKKLGDWSLVGDGVIPGIRFIHNHENFPIDRELRLPAATEENPGIRFTPVEEKFSMLREWQRQVAHDATSGNSPASAGGNNSLLRESRVQVDSETLPAGLSAISEDNSPIFCEARTPASVKATAGSKPPLPRGVHSGMPRDWQLLAATAIREYSDALTVSDRVNSHPEWMVEALPDSVDAHPWIEPSLKAEADRNGAIIAEPDPGDRDSWLAGGGQPAESRPKRLEATVAAAFENKPRESAQPGEARPDPVLDFLEGIASGMKEIKGRLATLPAPETPSPAGEEVVWLEEEDLAGQLQKILRRQAIRKGIEIP